MRYASRFVPVGLLAAVLGACADTLEAPTAVPHNSSPPAAATGRLRDDGINRGDTHFSVEVVTTTHTDEGEFSATSGIASASGPDRAYIEGGYSADGSIRFNVWMEDVAASPNIGSVRLAHGNISIHDRRGIAVRTEPFNDMMEWAGFPGGSVVGAYFPSTPPRVGGCDVTAPDCLAATADLPAGMTVREFGELREVSFRPTMGIQTADAASDIEVVHRYRRAGRGGPHSNDWRLDESERRVRLPSSTGQRTVVTVSRHTYRTWHRNPARERAREEAARTAARDRVMAPSGGGLATASVAPTPAPQATEMSGAALTSLCQPGTARMERFREIERGYHVLYQHGFCSDASVWPAFDDRLSQFLPMRTSRAYSIDSRRSIEDQATELRATLPIRQPMRHVMIGHSQGGLVLRRLGQRFPELVHGVVTIGTPHLGSFIADVGPDEAMRVLRDAARAECFLPEICSVVRHLLGGVSENPAGFGIVDFVPSVGDLRTGSAFLQALNATAEPFPRVSVEVTPSKRWVLWRMLGDRDSPSTRIVEGRRPAGDGTVTSVEQAYAIAYFTNAAAASFLWYHAFQQLRGTVCSRDGFASLWPACTEADAGRQWDDGLMQLTLTWLLYYISGAAMDLLNSIDRAWDGLTTKRSGQTDGLIHQASQRYPSVPGSTPPLRLLIAGATADSHAGQTKSPPVIFSVMEAVGHMDRVTVP